MLPVSHIVTYQRGTLDCFLFDSLRLAGADPAKVIVIDVNHDVEHVMLQSDTVVANALDTPAKTVAADDQRLNQDDLASSKRLFASDLDIRMALRVMGLNKEIQIALCHDRTSWNDKYRDAV